MEGQARKSGQVFPMKIIAFWLGMISLQYLVLHSIINWISLLGEKKEQHRTWYCYTQGVSCSIYWCSICQNTCTMLKNVEQSD